MQRPELTRARRAPSGKGSPQFGNFRSKTVTKSIKSQRYLQKGRRRGAKEMERKKVFRERGRRRLLGKRDTGYVDDQKRYVRIKKDINNEIK